MVFIHPEKKFTDHNEALAKIQIDNCYHFGWKKEDILLVTNFKFEYKGVNSIVVGDENFCTVRPLSTKTTIVPLVIEMGLLDGDLCWVHDLNAYQLNPISEDELGLEAFDVGLTDYGWKKRWALGSFFVKESSKDIFACVKERVFKRMLSDPSVSSEDESIFVKMMQGNDLDVNKRCKKLNITYNFTIRQIKDVYKEATKPLKVLHFRPEEYRLNQFMYGANDLKRPLMTKRLIKLFQHHGIK